MEEKENRESKNLGDFRRYKVPELKSFLRDRGLKVTGTKEELAALAYGAHELGISVKPSAAEENSRKKIQYNSLLKFEGFQLPDPFSLSSGWLDEDVGIKKWPPIFQLHIAEFLLTAEQSQTALKKRLLSDYKEGKAYSYFDSKWLKNVYYHEVNSSSKYCFLKSESTPSQNINNVPHRIWVCAEKLTGTVVSAYCTCFAGYVNTLRHFFDIYRFYFNSYRLTLYNFIIVLYFEPIMI